MTILKEILNYGITKINNKEKSFSRRKGNVAEKIPKSLVK